MTAHPLTPARKFVTRHEAAEHFRITTRTLDRMIKAGTVPTYKIGLRGIRINIVEAENAMVVRREAGISE